MAALAGAILIHSLPTLNAKLSPSDDWLRLCALNGAARRTVLVERAFPFRSPYFGGGYPTIAEPEDPTFSPFFLLALAFGEAYGLKLRALCCVVVAGWGAFWFARRHLGLCRWGALAASGLLVSASWFHARHLGGNVTEMQYCFVPVLLCLLLRSPARLWATAAAAAILAVVALDGKLVWASTVLYLGLVSLTWAAANRGRQRRFWRAPARVLAAAALSLLLAAAKVVPMVSLLHERGSATRPEVYPHRAGYCAASIGGYKSSVLLASLLDTSYSPGENRAMRLTVGYVALAIGAAALLLGWRRLWWMVLPGLICGWLMFSHHARPDLFWLLWHCPPFHVMTFPNKYFDFFVLLTLSLLCGWLLTHMRRWLRPSIARVLLPLLVAGMLWQPYRASLEITRHIYSKPCEPARSSAEFYQVQSAFEPRSRHRLPQSDAYLNLLSNVGTLDWFTPLPLRTAVQPRFLVLPDGTDRANPSYKGEVHARPQANSARLIAHHPTRMVLATAFEEPGQVVVNQNYSRWWRADHGAVVDCDGLLALAAVQPGSRTIVLRYFAWDVAFGLAISIAAALATVVVLGRDWFRPQSAERRAMEVLD